MIQPVVVPLEAAEPGAGSTLPLSLPTPLWVSSGQPAGSRLPAAETGLRWLVDQREAVRRWLGDVAVAVAARAGAGAGWVIRVAADRALSPNSVTGVGFLLGLCAAAWFSAGTRPDGWRGLAAVGAWAAARTGARYLEAITARRAGRLAPRRTRAGRADRTDWLVLPGFDWSDRADQPLGVATVARRKELAGKPGFGWLFEVTTTAAQCAIYGGIAAGAQTAGWSGTWALAVVAVISVSVAGVARTFWAALSPSSRGQAEKVSHPLGRLGWLTSPPVGVKVLLAGLITVNYGPRLALFSVSVIESTSLVTSMARITARTRSPVAAAAGPTWPDLLLTSRDDGPLARRAGWLVRGNLMPVPPTLAGLIAIGLLTVIGMRNQSDIVALAPVVVLLLAAPGSSHPHDGRFDWVAPLLLCLCQYGYLAAFGVARSVAGPVIFVTCSITAVWYTSRVAGRGPSAPTKTSSARTSRAAGRGQRIRQIMARRGEGIGWEGRVGLVCLAGMFGIATFGYLGLTACLVTLLGRKVVIGYLIPGEDRRR